MISAMQKTQKENTESSHKIGFYSLKCHKCHAMCQSVYELIKSWSLHLNQIAIWTRLH